MTKASRPMKGDLMVRRNRAGYVFIAPFLIGFLLFIAIPMLQSFNFSFNDIKLVENGYELIHKGTDNYKHILFVDTDFRMRIVNSLLSTFRDTVVVIPFSFVSAFVLNKKFKGRTFARAIFFLPVVVSSGVLASMDNNELITMVMQRSSAESFASAETSASAVAFVNMLFANSLPTELTQFVAQAADGIYNIIIKSGVQIIIFMGGLNTIAPSIYESSNIEGATVWVNFWKITFPMCGPYILLNIIYTIIDSFTNISNPLIAQIRNDLIGLKNFGVASAAAWIYFIIIFITLGIVFAIISRRVYYRE
ncbi:MAG: sugar ABC transporter permease [Oscillospiraceae bacterium]